MSSTVVSIQRDTKKMKPQDAAFTYYLRMKETGDSQGCVESCMRMLVLEHSISEKEASHIAVNAYAEQKSVNCREFIDVDRCTSYVVAIKTPEGHMYIPLSDLLLFAKGMDDSQATTLH